MKTLKCLNAPTKYSEQFCPAYLKPKVEQAQHQILRIILKIASLWRDWNGSSQPGAEERERGNVMKDYQFQREVNCLRVQNMNIYLTAYFASCCKQE